MQKKRALIVGALGLVLGAASAQAAPVTPAPVAAVDVGSMLELANHGTKICVLGQRGWHYHDGGQRIVCVKHPGRVWIWHCGSRYGKPHCGWRHRFFRSRWH